MEAKALHPITVLPRDLIAVAGQSRSYRAIWLAAVAGTIPAERINGRWHYRSTDVPQIALALGLTIAVRPAALVA